MLNNIVFFPQHSGHSFKQLDEVYDQHVSLVTDEVCEILLAGENEKVVTINNPLNRLLWSQARPSCVRAACSKLVS